MASVEDRARQLLEGRLASVRELVTASQVVTDLEEKLRTAKVRQLESYRAAGKAGWAPAELRELGFSDPSEPPRRPSRPRRSGGAKTPPAAPAPVASATGDGGEPQ